MSPTSNPNSNDKKTNAQQAGDPNSRRQRLRAEQEQAAREAKVRRTITFGGLGVIGLVVIGLIVWGVIGAMGAAKQNAGNKISATYAVVIGKDAAPVTLDVFQDFMCPVCGEFEKANSDDISKFIDAGTVRLRIHPMNFLDDASLGTKFSTRAANAFVTIWKAEPDKALAFNAALYENQPDEGTPGPTDDQLKALATGVGVSQAVADSFTSMANEAAVVQATQSAFAAGINSTPTVKINGEKFTGNTSQAGTLKAAVEAASK